MADNNTTPNRTEQEFADQMARECAHEQDAILFTEDELKMIALAKHLDIDPEDIEQSDYDAMTFDADGEEYLVCTDEEADNRAGDSIRDDLWTFNASFLLPHTILPCGAEDVIESLGNAKYEDANPALEAMIPDMDALIDDAISSDGRGHFLDFYDGEEHESNGLYIYQM